MTEAISKAALLEYLTNKIQNAKYGKEAHAYQTVLMAIEQSNDFDLSPTDVDVKEIEESVESMEWRDTDPLIRKKMTIEVYKVRQLLTKNAELESTIGELSEERNQKHARNERLEKELAEEKNLTWKYKADRDLALARLAEKEAELQEERRSAREVFENWDKRNHQLHTKLNQASEALERIYLTAIGNEKEIARQAIQQIKGEQP